MSRTRFRFVAPAGAPISEADLRRWAVRMTARSDVVTDLEEAFKRLVGLRHCRVTCSGRAGLTSLLRAFRRIGPTHRDEVVVSSYTCFSVAASVVKAGLKPRIIDVDPSTLDFDFKELEAADFTRVLAVVATNLYGLPNDLPRIARLASSRGVFLIDDAAQALGASVGGRASGTWGDAGLYSLDKGKNVSAIEGGVVVTNSDDVAAALGRELTGLEVPGVAESAAAVLKALVYFVFLRPWLYGVPNAIPQLGLGRTVFTTDFPLHVPGRPLTALALETLTHLPQFTEARQHNARSYLEALEGSPDVEPVQPVASALPVYLRLPVLLASRARREDALDALNRAGIGASRSYPASLADVPELQPHAVDGQGTAVAGRTVADRILTLPTHPFVSSGDIARALAILESRRAHACAAPGWTAAAR